VISVETSRNMVGTLKTFDKAEHSQYDNKGKDALMKYLNSQGETTIKNPNQYGIDLLTVENDVVKGCWEVEVRHGNWRGDVPFPFNKINCIERKDYLWRKDQELFDKIPFAVDSEAKIYYVQLNNECNRAVIIDGDTVLQYPLVSWDNRKTAGEYVRQVPISKCLQVKLT